MLVVAVCRYQGRRTETNMVIINIKLLSGYVVDKSSIENVSFTLQHLWRGLGGVYEYSDDGCVFQQLKTTGKGVKRVDVEEGYVNIYIDGVGNLLSNYSECILFDVTSLSAEYFNYNMLGRF